MKNDIKIKRSKKCKIQITFCKLLFVSVLLMVNYALLPAQSLNELLQLTTQNNSILKSLQLEYEAELLKVDQVSQLENPQIGLGVPVLRPETRLGGQVVMISASQMFPWFRTLKSKKEVVLSMSKAKHERISALKLNLFSKVKIAYYQLSFLKEKQAILNKFLGVYKTLESVSLAKVESGQSTTADVLRIQLKIQEINQEMNIIENKKAIYNAKINEVTNQPFETKINPTDILKTNKLLAFDIKSYQTKIKANHPLMIKLDNEIEASKNKQHVNSKMNSPKIGLGIDYSMVNKRTDANPQYNGQDIFIPKVKLSIPIYRKVYRAKNAQETKYQEALSEQKINLENKMVSRLLQYKTNYDNAILKIELYEQQTKITKMAYEVLLANYSSKGKGFDDLLQIQNKLLTYELGKEKERLNVLKSIANIDSIVNF